ncbi:hypothetical protein PR202_ga09160 [Eleusine coracana subsp. coracana]|uniref:HIT-type domain-containing protein n=1 Tax=Eleusine coracana subsp. coracana TaxID=191504 RepID=A0AAV5C1U1_ELECO|nr:hypothetical protein PR202_ga09160 [Eleusine coracana subsp. coracana]
MAGGTCSVCNEAPSKYKCPSCRTPYCSVTCFKNHKAHGSGLQEGGADCINGKDQQAASAPDTTCPAKPPNTLCPPTKALEVEDPSWLVDNNRLRSIAELKEIRDAVRDPELQKLILKIDGSSEPEKELEKLMEGQAFRQFTDKSSPFPFGPLAPPPLARTFTSPIAASSSFAGDSHASSLCRLFIFCYIGSKEVCRDSSVHEPAAGAASAP